MKTLKLFALALAVAGMIGTEVNAGGRRSRGCSGGSCSNYSTVSTCSGGTCGQVVTTTSSTQAAPATAPAPKETGASSTVTTSAPVSTSTCANGTCSTGTCSSGNCYSGRGRHGR
jgi:hypothetical protein